MQEDQRITDARDYATVNGGSVERIINDLIAYAEERARINTGLVSENASLRGKVNKPEVIDLTEIDTRDLFAEVAHRLEDKHE